MIQGNDMETSSHTFALFLFMTLKETYLFLILTEAS